MCKEGNPILLDHPAILAEKSLVYSCYLVTSDEIGVTLPDRLEFSLFPAVARRIDLATLDAHEAGFQISRNFFQMSKLRGLRKAREDKPCELVKDALAG